MRKGGKAGEPLRLLEGATIVFEAKRAVLLDVYAEIVKDEVVVWSTFDETDGQHDTRATVTMNCQTHGYMKKTAMTVLDRARRRATPDGDSRGAIFYGSWLVNPGTITKVPKLCTKADGFPCESCRMHS